MSKCVLIECLSNINDVIKQPLQQTQRIKFSSFDVSSNYLVFGASSGGVYVFSRQPCKFIKLIPSKEGAITNLLISPDEKAIAITTRKNVAIIIENCFADANFRFHIYSLQEGTIVTDMKWSQSELYCSSQKGQISVISQTNLLPKTIFQRTCEPLMNLDSSIIQIEVYLKYLLVSTRTRTYLCNIEQEEYKQIGKKLRDGNFGACFYERGKARIYCARPGCRLWETDFDSNVICTHQFRESLKVESADVFCLDEENFEVKKQPGGGRISDSFNFGKIKVIEDFIITFNEDGFYIFDIEEINLKFWVECRGIVDLKIIENFAYIWTKSFSIKCFKLVKIDELICKFLSWKKYDLCGELCLLWKDDVLQLIKNNKLQAIAILKENLEHNLSLLEQLKPMLEEVRECKVVTAQKLESGIFLVNDNTNSIVIKSQQKIENLKTTTEDDCMDIFYNQYQLNKINNMAESPKFARLLDSKKLNEVVELFSKFMMQEEESKDWCSLQMLRYVSKQKLNDDIDNNKSPNFKFIEECFVNMNQTGSDLACTCAFPLPTAKCEVPCFYEIGCEILKNNLSSGEPISICRSVPFMYKYLIELRKDDNIATLLPLIIQYSDVQIFSEFQSKFSYDIWDSMTKSLIKLKKNVCLNCEHVVQFDVSSTISWTDFGKILVKSLGGPNAVNLLLRNSKHIPPGELDADFYQTAVFSTVLENLHDCDKSKATNFLKNLDGDEDIKKECSNLLANYFHKKYMGALTSSYASDIQSCSICSISLRSPVLDAVTKLSCGHHCHTVCSKSKELCKLCDKKSVKM